MSYAVSKQLPQIELTHKHKNACAGHLVQFYKEVDYLSVSVAEYLRIGLAQNEGILLLATPAHKESIFKALTSDLNRLNFCMSTGQLVYINALEFRQAIETPDGLDQEKFLQTISERLEKLRAKFAKTRCYGELVDILASEGRIGDSIAVEELWNDLLRKNTGVSLLCGYCADHLAAIGDPKHDHFQSVIDVHADLIQVENIHGEDTEDALYRKIAVLEQRASAFRIEAREKKQILSEMEQVKLELAQRGKLTILGELCAGIAHELNNPLVIVKGGVRYIEQKLTAVEDWTLYPDIQKKLDKINDASDRMAGIIRNVLMFARQEAYEYQNFSIKNAVNSSIELMRDQLTASHIQLKINVPNEDLTIHGDRNLIVQALVNVMSNAREALDLREDARHRVLEFSVQSMNDEVLIAIEDNGIGMSEETRSKVFYPFFTTKKVGEGSGLGMSISHGIISQHQGRMSCESVLGEGTCFRIVLPLVRANQLDADS